MTTKILVGDMKEFENKGENKRKEKQHKKRIQIH